ncbi:MAG: hypothetical protein H6624_04860 [Bdellovibrionaceae bacterium]|nr:hypothetical protein [Bdellovibrionales bacterium]MCB9083648.1 hypothetical protein [Pseudobdellovibrionaceae bacterium]
MKKLIIAIGLLLAGLSTSGFGQNLARAEGDPQRVQFCTELRAHIQQLSFYREHLKANLRVAIASQNAPAAQKLQQEIQRVSVILRNMKIVFAEECL